MLCLFPFTTPELEAQRLKIGDMPLPAEAFFIGIPVEEAIELVGQAYFDRIEAQKDSQKPKRAYPVFV